MIEFRLMLMIGVGRSNPAIIAGVSAVKDKIHPANEIGNPDPLKLPNRLIGKAPRGIAIPSTALTVSLSTPSRLSAVIW
ncbi:hypothetical protein D3C71_2031300 [compost metagenome]